MNLWKFYFILKYFGYMILCVIWIINIFMYFGCIKLVLSLKNKFFLLIIIDYFWKYKENLIRLGLELYGFDFFFFSFY